MDTKKKILSLILALSVIGAWLLYLSNHRIKIALTPYLNRMEAGQDTLIDLQKIIGKDFNRIYITGEAVPPSLISDALGFRYGGSWVEDSEHRIILLKGNTIVYQEDIESGILNFKQSRAVSSTKLIVSKFNPYMLFISTDSTNTIVIP